MKLPKAFLERMKNDLGNEFDSFVQAYNDNPHIALRVNTLKISCEELKEIVDFCGEDVPWCENGFYYDGKKGNHPAQLSGLFYSQEPSAMIAAELLNVTPGEKVLDLCAAPGGKSTQLAARLNGNGLMVCNEINPGRAKILCENIERMGIKNAVITNMHPEKLEKLFEDFFDKIVVDAPCSGEGMFRKEPLAVENWSLEHTFSCALRQGAILESAYNMLAGGGELVYSTCTFSSEENENVVREFIAKHSDMELVEEHRLMPHKIKGEGHFSALLKKRSAKKDIIYKQAKSAAQEIINKYREFEKENLNTTVSGNFVSFGDYLYVMPEEMISLDRIKCVRPGLLLGEIRKGRFVPSHHLCMALKKEDFKRYILMSDEQIASYLKGDAIACEAEKGYGAVLYASKYPLGWYKYSDGYAKNHYPKNLRIF